MEDTAELDPLEEGQPEVEEKTSRQNLTCFPSDNTKHIDYVITYKYDTDYEEKESHKAKEAIRNGFIEMVKKENIDVYTVRHVEDSNCYVVHLLNCSMDRLLSEAEKMKLEMRLNNVTSPPQSLFIIRNFFWT